MSTTFERTRMGLAVVLAAALLGLSAVAFQSDRFFLPAPTAADIAGVRNAVAVLSSGRSPLVGIQPCDAVKALLPERFTRQQGDAKISQSAGADVIVCFRDSIDYQQALAAARERGLTWTAGIGGDRVVVFAPSGERLAEVASLNGLSLRARDLVGWSPMLHALKAQGHARQEQGQWLIDPAPQQVEALFGPYLDLKPGAYRVTLALEGVGPADCAALVRERIALAVSAEGRTRVLAPAKVLPLIPEGGKGGCRYAAATEFTVPQGGARSVETPIWVQGSARMRLVSYSLGR